jgi:tetratricopeptide (TPR) repeat protein
MTDDELRAQQAVLDAQRRTLLHLLGQEATFGAGFVPAHIAAGIDEARTAIRHIKAELRATGATIDDQSQDDAPTARAAAAMPLNTVPAVATLPPGSRMPLAPNPLFVGRDDELLTLARALSSGATTVIAAATGLGGIGKTQLATEFVHRYGQYFPGGVFWLSFAEPTAVPGEVATCGGPGGMNLPNFAALSLTDQVARVRGEWQQATPRLLVFDNCEDEQLLAKWRPTSGGCHILLTARRGAWNPSLGVRTLPLQVLQRSRSVELMRQFRPELPADDPSLMAIAQELGDLPLALHVAGSFLGLYHADVSTQDYLAELRTTTIDHESLQGDESGISPTNHDLSVYRSIKLSYDKLDTADATDMLALALLARAACFAPGEPIPRDLLLKAVDLPDTTAQRRATRAIQRLIDLGLLEVEAAGAPRLHRLVGAFVRAEQPDTAAQRAVEELLKNTGAALLNKGIPAPLSAIQAHLRHVTDVAQKRDDRHTSDLCAIMGRYLRLVGSYTAAQSYLERALAIEEGHDDRDARRLSLRLDRLASLLEDLGNYPAARPLFERALAMAEASLGPDHPDTGARLNNLALLLQKQGDYMAARPLLERALAMAEASLGPDHPDTSIQLNNLALLLKDLGDYTAARPLYERALAIAEASLGPDHPTTGIRLNNLGMLLQAQGDYMAARPLFERALAITEASLGPDHPTTCIRLSNLASLLKAQGDYMAARPLFERALAITEASLGPDHPTTSTRLSNLGMLLQAQGDYMAARPLYERGLAIAEASLGPDHPSISIRLNNLALLLQAQGDYLAARRLCERALAIATQALGASHPHTQLYQRNLAALPPPSPDPTEQES